MKRLVIFPLLAAGVALGGCTTTSAPPVNPVLEVAPEQIAAQVAKACGFLPAVIDVPKIVAVLGGPSLPDIEGKVVNAICSGRMTQSGRTNAVVIVQGIPVHGERVRRPAGA